MVSVLHKELQHKVQKLEFKKLEGSQEWKTNPNFQLVKKMSRISDWLIQSLIYQWRIINERQGAYWLPSPEKGDGLFERGGLFDGGGGGGLNEDLR